MIKIEIPAKKSINWPDCCAYCTHKSDTEVKLKYSVISGINPFFYTRKIAAFKHPVCKRHRLVAQFYAFFSHQSIVDLFAGFLFIPLILFLPLLFVSYIPAQLHTSIFLMICAFYIMCVVLLKVRQPVKIKVKKSGIISIKFRCQAYAQKFKKENFID